MLDAPGLEQPSMRAGTLPKTTASGPKGPKEYSSKMQKTLPVVMDRPARTNMVAQRERLDQTPETHRLRDSKYTQQSTDTPQAHTQVGTGPPRIARQPGLELINRPGTDTEGHD